MNNAFPLPTESIEQTRLFQWARSQRGKYPELALMFHIPNGGSRHKAEAKNLKGQGVKAGVPDLCLPVARCGCHGLFIELKRQKGGRVSEAQGEWVKDLTHQGYCVTVCPGWESASRIILNYLQNKPIDCTDYEYRPGAKGQCAVPVIKGL